MKKVTINWGKLVDVRFWLMNFDTDVTDTNGGVRFNREHLKRVLKVRNLPADEKLSKIWIRNYENNK